MISTKPMSADNAIIYAKFKDGWRVTEAQAIDNFSFFKAGTIGYNLTVREYFKDVEPLVFDEGEEQVLFNKIEQLKDDAWYVEYGSVYVGDFSKLDYDILSVQEHQKITKQFLYDMGFDGFEDKEMFKNIHHHESMMMIGNIFAKCFCDQGDENGELLFDYFLIKMKEEELELAVYSKEQLEEILKSLS